MANVFHYTCCAIAKSARRRKACRVASFIEVINGRKLLVINAEILVKRLLNWRAFSLADILETSSESCWKGPFRLTIYVW
jgi:hypothetical protein